MQTRMLSERKNIESRKAFLYSRLMNTAVLTVIMAVCLMCTTCLAADGSEAITTAKTLLSKAATAGGGLWAVWGLVTLGMAIKDHNGPGIGNAVWQIVGGAIIIAAGVAINALDLSMSV